MADQERAAALADEIEAHTAAFGDFEALGVKVHENRNEVITALRRLAEQSAPAPADALKAVARALAESDGCDPDEPAAEPSWFSYEPGARAVISAISAVWHVIPPRGSAAADVLAERCRQVEVEWWSPERDDDIHASGELAMAAGAYAWFAGAGNKARAYLQDQHRVPRDWPWDPCWFKPTTPRRDLVKAAALILAEIERIDRAALAAKEP